VTDGGRWPGEDTAETQVMGLSQEARRVLATLAVIGRASLSADELADLVEVADVAPVIDDLERQGLIERDRHGRYEVVERVGGPIRRADEASSSADRLLQYLAALARGGELTPARLAEDAGAILGLSEWAAATRRWATVLELVKALQGCYRVAHRVQEWLALLEHGRSAARALGDTRQEIWMLEQLASASQAAGDSDAARRYAREADELSRGGVPTVERTFRPETSAAAGRSLPRLALWLLSLVVVGGAGAGAGYALGNGNGDVGVTTTQVKVTATVRGRTTTATKTITLPATTVVSTTTTVSTTTETTTVTTTTTTAAQIP
jgi:hypothetical protein